MEIPITIRQATLSDLEEMLAIEEANPSSEESLSRQSLEESIRKTAGTFLVAGDEISSWAMFWEKISLFIPNG